MSYLILSRVALFVMVRFCKCNWSRRIRYRERWQFSGEFNPTTKQKLVNDCVKYTFHLEFTGTDYICTHGFSSHYLISKWPYLHTENIFIIAMGHNTKFKSRAEGKASARSWVRSNFAIAYCFRWPVLLCMHKIIHKQTNKHKRNLSRRLAGIMDPFSIKAMQAYLKTQVDWI